LLEVIDTLADVGDPASTPAAGKGCVIASEKSPLTTMLVTTSNTDADRVIELDAPVTITE
jgi:hypothetical protein